MNRPTSRKARVTHSRTTVSRDRSPEGQADEPVDITLTPRTRRNVRNSSSLPVVDLTASLTEEVIVVEDSPTVPEGRRRARGRKRRRESDSELPIELSPSPNKKCNTEQKPEHEKGTVMCPVCLLTAQEVCSGSNHMVSTTCGHVFCNTCLDNCLKKKQVCPTCRRKKTKKDIIKLFL